MRSIYNIFMSYISSTRRAFYQARMESWESRLTSAETYYEFLMSTEGASSFKFDSGEASSWAKYTEPDVFMDKVIAPIEAWIDHYRNKMNGTGIIRLNLSMGR